MKASFRSLAALVLLLPLSYRALASASSSAPQSGHEGIICHGSKCYPRVFIPTEEFQVIEPDQDIPAGIHLRLNLGTGLREGKINVPGEGAEFEGVAVELPPNGSDSLLVVGAEAPPDPSINIPPPPVNDDPYGFIKVPHSAPAEEIPFADAVSIILDAPLFSIPKLNEALSSLENLVHEMYWGLQLSTPRNINALLNLIGNSANPTIRSSAATVLGSALQNNPKALKSALESGEVKLMKMLVEALEKEIDDSTRLRVMYALNQGIKSDQTRGEFLAMDGLAKLLKLFQDITTGGGEFRGKVSTFIEDNFCNDDMRSDAPTFKRAKGHHQDQPQQIPLQAGKEITNGPYAEDPVFRKAVLAFCRPLQEALMSSKAVSDDVKIKILNAVVAMEAKYGKSRTPCGLDDDFVQWLWDQVSGEQDVGKLEDAGSWFKIRVLEIQDLLSIS